MEPSLLYHLPTALYGLSIIILGQLKNQKELTKQLEVQVKDLTRKNDDLKSEIEGVRTAAQLTNETEREQLVSLKQSHQEEIASLHHIYNGNLVFLVYSIIY